MKLYHITDGKDWYIAETDNTNEWVTGHLDLSKQWTVSKWVALPARDFARCNDFIFTADYKRFYFNDGLEYHEILNNGYLADIRKVYATRITGGVIVATIGGRMAQTTECGF